jgi:hypothetical protein
VTLTAGIEQIRTASLLVNVEPMTGIEPAYSAWEADVLPLNYIGVWLKRLAVPDQRLAGTAGAWSRAEP